MPEEKDQVSATPAAPVAEPVTEPGVQGDSVDPKDAVIKNVRSEAASWRVKFQNLNKKVEEIENKSKLDKMEESERLTIIAQQARAEADTYKKQAKDANVKSAALAEASSMGFIDPQFVVNNINIESITVDELGHADSEAIRLQLGTIAEKAPYTVRGNEQPKTLIQRGQFGPSSQASPRYPAADDRSFIPANRVVTDTDALMKGQMGTQEYFSRAAESFERNKLLDPSARGAELPDKGG